MKAYTRDYRTGHITGRAFSRYFGGMRPCVFDIETTGLDPSRCKVIMTALLTETSDGVRVTQYLAENPYEEEKVLEASMRFLIDEGIDYLVTFNGAGFDVPFVNHRLEKLMMPHHLSLYNLDVYRFVRRETILPKIMKSLRQKMVEEYFGFSGDRMDTISGRESIALYEKFALTGDSVSERTILTHNREDVVQLYRITEALMKDSFAEALCSGCHHKAISSYGLPVPSADNGIILTAHPELSRKGLRITGTQLSHPISAASFRDSEYSPDADFRASSASYEISLMPRSYRDSLFVSFSDVPVDDEGVRRLSSHSSYCENCFIIQDSGRVDTEALNLLALEISRSYFQRKL